MPPLGREKSSLERRLKELQKEEESLRKNMRSLNRILSDPEQAFKEVPEKEKKPNSFFGKYFKREQKPAEPTQDVEPEPEPPPPPSRSNSPRSEVVTHDPIPHNPPPSEDTARRPENTDKKQRVVDGKFATYITTGSFIPATATRRTKPIQRNRAIFMVIVLIVALIIVMQIFHFFDW